MPEKIVKAILEELHDRAGFDHWFYTIPEDIQDEIVDSLEEIVGDILEDR